jgi:hypothetical protein
MMNDEVRMWGGGQWPINRGKNLYIANKLGAAASQPVQPKKTWRRRFEFDEKTWLPLNQSCGE